MSTLSSIRETTLHANGIRFHALTAGPESGEPVLLLHGFPELSESWRDVLGILAERGFRAVAPDLRGYGKTDKPESGYDLDTLAEDTVALLEVVGGGSAHLVGHDWGGAIAYHVAAYHPEKVRRMAVVNCVPVPVMASRAWMPRQLLRSWYILFFQLPWLPERLLSREQGGAVPKLLRGASVNKTHLTRERLSPYAKAFSTPEDLSGPLAYYREAARGLLRPERFRRQTRYPRSPVPFRLVWGMKDEALGVELTERLDRFFSGPFDVKFLPDVGHFAPIEAPDRVGPLVAEHLATQAESRHVG